MRYRSVIGFGRASFVEMEAEKRQAPDLLMRKYAGDGSWTYPRDAVAGTRVVRIDVEQMTGKQSAFGV